MLHGWSAIHPKRRYYRPSSEGRQDGAPCPKDQAPTGIAIPDSLRSTDLVKCRVHFPGAVNSKFTTKLSFEHPSTHPAMPTYRVMDSDGMVVDQSREPAGIDSEEIKAWYRNMLTGMNLSKH